MSRQKKINDQINRAIATTVVVTAIGISSTINSIPVRAGSPFNRNKQEETYYSESATESNQVEESIGVETLEFNELITSLLKEGKYAEAREIRKSFTKYINPLAAELRSLGNYAVHTV